ncbi:MAG: RNA pseudouridine synthase [Treponema sp.]|nr:RNA pseudouridine synthase [Treponema sp.]
MNKAAPPLASRILYQSPGLVIVNKLPGEAAGNAGPGIARLSGDLSALLGGGPVTAVNRLDVPVSGCILFARAPDALAAACALFREGAVQKRYLAVAETPENAAPLPENGLLIHWLGRDGRRNRSAVFDGPGPDRKRAALRCRVCGQGERYTFLELELISGRHHQIRAQLAAAGFRIKGDLKYGARRSDGIGVRLHAYSLAFRAPGAGLIRASAPPPVMDRLWQACWESLEGPDLVSVHKVGYFADRPCIFSPKGCENAVFKDVCP